MCESVEPVVLEQTEYLGTYCDGVIRLAGPVDWDDGTPVQVRIACLPPAPAQGIGRAIIAGFGLAGRWVAEIFDRYGIEYVVVERNPETIAAQRRIGRQVIEGDISQEETLRRAGVETAATLVLTVPNEAALREATRAARALNPRLYIVGRTVYSSTGMKIEQLGADEVIKVEQVVARQFYEIMLRKVLATGATMKD